MNNKITSYLTPKSSKRNRSNSSPELNTSSEKKTKTSDMPQVGSMSVEQLKSLFSDLLDSKNFATKDDINQLSARVESLQAENEIIREELNKYKNKTKMLENQVEYMSQQFKKNKLIFYGVDMTEEQNSTDLIKDICSSILKVSTSCFNIANIKPIGRINNGRVPLLVEFQSENEVHLILKNRRILKDTGE